MSDIQRSFTFLHDSVPQWLHDIACVEEKVTAMQDNLTKVPLSLSLFAKHKTNSTTSIRRERLAAIAEQAPPCHDAQTDPVGNRKRKTLSLLSDHASGPSRYRPRTMVVMNYDGDVQKSFELLVRAIGTARNMLRKAKMEARMNELAALADSSEDDDEADEDAEDAIVAKISYRPRMASMRARTAARRNGQPGTSGASNASVELFDSTDKLLEQAQEQCERAAHVTLRDGDCRKELQSVRHNLENVLDTAKSQVSMCNATTAPEPPELPSRDTSNTSISSAEPLYKRHFPQICRPPPSLTAEAGSVLPTAPTSTLQSQAKVINIEVDDEDDDEDDFVMPPVRLTSRLAARA